MKVRANHTTTEEEIDFVTTTCRLVRPEPQPAWWASDRQEHTT